MLLLSPGKVNLILRVGQPGSEGLHEIFSLVTAVDVYDELVLAPASKPSFTCDNEDINNADNLCWKALLALESYLGTPLPISISLRKLLPLGAGLGGGSGNAAAVLVGVNRLLGLGLTTADLVGVAASLGSDVPFFIRGGTQLVRGFGETLDDVSLDALSLVWLVLVNPGVEVSTTEIYRLLDESRADGDRRQGQISFPPISPGEPLETVLANDLQDIAESRYPVTAQARQDLTEVGARATLLCGSGASVFGMFDDEINARKAAERLSGRWTWVRVARPGASISMRAA